MLNLSFLDELFLANKQPLVTAVLKVNHPCFPPYLCSKHACHLYSSYFIGKNNPSLKSIQNFILHVMNFIIKQRISKQLATIASETPWTQLIERAHHMYLVAKKKEKKRNWRLNEINLGSILGSCFYKVRLGTRKKEKKQHNSTPSYLSF